MKRTDKEQKRNGKGLERELWMVFSLKRLQNSSDSNELIYFLSSKSKHKVQNGWGKIDRQNKKDA